MISFFKIFFRNLRRGGVYSAINTGGLAVGMAAAMLIFVWIRHEWSYDRFHAKEKQLYKVWQRFTYDGDLQCNEWLPQPARLALKENYPEIVATARMDEITFLVTVGDEKLRLSVGFTDPDFLTMFDFPLLRGSKETALNDPNSIVLTESTANRLFGNDDPIGKPLLLNNRYTLTVSGILKDLPDNTDFRFETLVPMTFCKAIGWYDESWYNSSPEIYAELLPGANPDAVNRSVRDLIREHTEGKDGGEVFIYPLSRQHLYSEFENGVPSGGLIDTLRIFGLAAIAILLIACINSVNLSTARSEKRAKETGIRKTLGCKRRSLIGQFLGESILQALIAGIAALIIAALLLPRFAALTGKHLTLGLGNGWFWPAFLVFILFTGLLSGIWPAFRLSAFLPVKVLKGIFKSEQTLTAPRRILVIVQFTVACFMIFAVSVIYRQIQYAQDRQTGYDKDRLIYHILTGNLGKNYELVKQELLNSGTAVSVTKTNLSMSSQSRANTQGIEWRGKNPNEKPAFDLYFVDADWTKTVGTTIIEGRDLDVYSYPTDSSALLLNETAVRQMNFDQPLGEIVHWRNKDWRVVGVVKDFILRSPYQPIRPGIIGGPGGWFEGMHIKFNGKNTTAENLAEAERIFKKYNPAYPFEYSFVDEAYARNFESEQRTGVLITWFAGLAILISCMGIFALVAYMAEARKKEIGIRKVLGASVKDVVSLLSKEFLILVLISVIIASPAAWWAMNKWLSPYAYRTDIPWWLFVAVGLVSVFIALITVSWQAVKAATADPVKSIKAE